MQSKPCFKCGKTLPLEAFYKHKKMADGHLNKCKECTKSDSTKNRKLNIDRYREYDRIRAKLPHRVEVHRKAASEWKKNHPDRKAAQSILFRAVNSGKVKKHPCWVCGEKAEAHHPDYSRPLDVVWLCSAHHKQTHALVKNCK